MSFIKLLEPDTRSVNTRMVDTRAVGTRAVDTWAVDTRSGCNSALYNVLLKPIFYK